METSPLHTLLEQDKTSALMANFALLFPGSFRMWLVDVAGHLVGYHPSTARDVDVQKLLPALERVQQLSRGPDEIAPVPGGAGAEVGANPCD